MKILKVRDKDGNIHEAVQFLKENCDQVYHWASEKQQNIRPNWDDDMKPMLGVPIDDGLLESNCRITDYLVLKHNSTTRCKFKVLGTYLFDTLYEVIQDNDTTVEQTKEALENERNILIEKVNAIDEQKRSIKVRLSALKECPIDNKNEIIKAKDKFRWLTDDRAKTIIKIGQIKKDIKDFKHNKLNELRLREKGYLSIFKKLNICPKNINEGACIQPLDFECTNKEHAEKCLKQYAKKLA